MAHAEDPHRVVVQREQNAVVAEAQAEGTRHVAVQGSHIAAAGAGVVENAVEDAHGGGAIQTADIGARFVEPFDTIRRHYRFSGKSSCRSPNSASTSSMG